MRMAVSSECFRREIPARMTVLQVPAWASSRGFDAVELAEAQLPAMTPEYRAELLRACDAAGVGIACLAVDTDFTVPEDDRRDAEMERVRRLLLEVAAPLGVPVVRVTMGQADASRAGDQRALEAFRALVPDLDATGIALALENHARVYTPPDKVEAIVAGVPITLFGSCLDFGSEPVDRRIVALEQLAPYALHVHARSYAFAEDGEETTIDYRRSLAILKAFGYDGVLSVLYQGAGDTAQGILATKALIEKHWFHPAMGREAA